METFPARLHAVFAKDKPYAVVFRRGPSKQVCTLLWDRRKDTFKLGQWLKGRIYERRTDLSPNGKYLIYFAMNGKWDSETGGSWTAISKAPWLKAIELYRKGDCWDGGGLFLSNNRFWLNDRYFTPGNTLNKSSEVVRDDSYTPEGEFGAEDTGVYYRRLIRDGWRLESHKDISNWNSVTIFEKDLPKGWILRKIAHEQVDSPKGKGCYWDEHELMNRESETMLNLHKWEWAELGPVNTN
ncbi:MAG: hypothetical protein G8D84_20395 [gamma proteobacterium symbiont of Clathrolucina costata]